MTRRRCALPSDPARRTQSREFKPMTTDFVRAGFSRLALDTAERLDRKIIHPSAHRAANVVVIVSRAVISPLRSRHLQFQNHP